MPYFACVNVCVCVTRKGNIKFREKSSIDWATKSKSARGRCLKINNLQACELYMRIFRIVAGDVVWAYECVRADWKEHTICSSYRRKSSSTRHTSIGENRAHSKPWQWEMGGNQYIIIYTWIQIQSINQSKDFNTIFWLYQSSALRLALSRSGSGFVPFFAAHS